MPRVPLQQDYARGSRYSLRNIVWMLIRAYHLAPSLVRSPLRWLLWKRLSHRYATLIGPQSKDKSALVRRPLRPEAARLPSARSERHELRILRRSQSCPKNSARGPMRSRLLSLAPAHSAPEPVSKRVGQSLTLDPPCQWYCNGATDPSAPHRGAGDD